MAGGRKLALLLILVSVTFKGMAQYSEIAVRLDSIKKTSDDGVKIVYANEIIKSLTASAFGSYDAAMVIKYLGYKRCMNDEAELFSWSVPMDNGLAYYNVFRFKEGQRSYVLKTLPGEDRTPAYLFYDLLAFKSDKEEYFVLLGWAQSKKSNQKAVLIAQFGPGGTVNFNKPLMRKGNSRSASLTFEYIKEGSMMLKHDKKGKRIVFDHLAPIDKKYEGYFMFYGPDSSYDALILKNGVWWYEENVKGK